jgi:chemotaxis protein MotA
MRLFPLSILVAAVSIYLSIYHLGQQIFSYFDYVAFVMVFGGTLAVSIVTFPWEYKKDLFHALTTLFGKEQIRYKEVIRLCLVLIRRGSKEIPNLKLSRNSAYERLLLDGNDMLELSFNQDRLEQILREKLFQSSKRYRRVANSLRSLAKYPPAFGLSGTVLGLVNIMRGLNNGLDAKQTAMEMSLALVATFYGLLLANLIINPAGELVLKKAHEEEELGELVLQTLLMLNKETSLLEAQEVLNSLVPDEHRIDISDHDVASAA